MLEAKVQKLVHLALSAAGARIFRQNVGLGWVGEIVRKTKTEITLKNPRPLHAGLCEGSSDLIGWTPVTITPEMVGKTLAVFTAVETKRSDGGRTSEAQSNFIAAVLRSGGIAGVVSGPDEATALISLRDTNAA